MRIDVSDLFDQLFEIAMYVRTKFDVNQKTDPQAESPEWDQSDATLSDALFLPACAKRVFAITHAPIPPAEIRNRLITELSPETLTKTVYYRYVRPWFGDGTAGFVVTNAGLEGAKSDENIFHRPKRKLSLWLGRLPPAEVIITPPPYPQDLDEPRQYFARQGFGFVSRAPHTSYFEFHGQWCLRIVEQRDAVFRRRVVGGQWRVKDELTEIPAYVFEAVWQGARDVDP